MSSVYRVLCLTHDPALPLGHDSGEEWSRPEPALAAATNPADYQITAPHAGCDLLVGEYSYPFVRVACPMSPGSRAQHRGYHPHAPEWVDVAWLRLLWHAHGQPDQALTAAADNAARLCWTSDRVNRLRYEIGAEEPAGPSSCCPDCDRVARP